MATLLDGLMSCLLKGKASKTVLTFYCCEQWHCAVHVVLRTDVLPFATTCACSLSSRVSARGCKLSTVGKLTKVTSCARIPELMWSTTICKHIKARYASTELYIICQIYAGPPNHASTKCFCRNSVDHSFGRGKVGEGAGRALKQSKGTSRGSCTVSWKLLEEHYIFFNKNILKIC